MKIRDRVKEILLAEADAIRAVSVDSTFERALLALRKCGGKIVTTGVGKAGHTARRFASVLCSTGTPAVFIHPGEALHGDLGLIRSTDCIVAFSTSGKTRELLDMIRLSRGLRPTPGPIIAITSHPESPLRSLSDIILDMGQIKEPCRLGLTPTASIAVMSAIADALALVLMDQKRISKEQFGRFHHAGYLGKKARTGAGPAANNRNRRSHRAASPL